MTFTASSRRRRTSASMEQEMRRMKEESKKRFDSYYSPRTSTSRKGATPTTDDSDEDCFDNEDKCVDEKAEQMKLVVHMAVRAGFLFVAGLSLCFSTFFIPGVVPFLGGLLCGVSPIEPPPLPGDKDTFGGTPNHKSNDGTPTKGRKYREREQSWRSGGDSGVVKQMLMNMIEHLF